MSETCWMQKYVTGVKTKNLSDDFDYVLEIPQLLFFGSWSGGERYKKESIWNFKNKVKIVPKILLYDNSHISLHPTCL